MLRFWIRLSATLFAGWLLASLERDFVIARLGEAGSAAGEEATA